MTRFINKILSKIPFGVSDFYLENTKDYFVLPPHISRNSELAESYKLGQDVFNWISIHVPLKLDSNVLDVGCGDGRVAAAFARKNNKFKGTYDGFDIHKTRVESLNKLMKNKKNFNFKYVDIQHSYYNPNGKEISHKFMFPYDDKSFDLLFLNSIFSHFNFKTIRHYLTEIKRCLKEDGKVWITCYNIDGKYDRNNKALSKRRFFDTVYEEGFTSQPEKPEGSVGYTEEKWFEAISDAHLKIEKYIPGYWKINRQSLDQHEQDIFVLKHA
tara:strand:+ start:104 stop:913 length:810 start_codon:yes stop_codon:yes gene_type:complete